MGGDKWICSVTSDVWDEYYNDAIKTLNELLEESCDDENSCIIKYEIAEDISSIKLFINKDDSLFASFEAFATRLIGSMVRFTLYGDTNVNCSLYDVGTGKLIS